MIDYFQQKKLSSNINELALKKFADRIRNFCVMEIKFLKKENDKHTLTCWRKDGTNTWINADSFFLRHDLLHYIVETKLKMYSAFYGMIAKGKAITDFDLPKDKRHMEFSEEALLAEHIVNLIMIESAQEKFNDFNHMLNDSLKQAGHKFKNCVLTKEEQQSIHTDYNLLLQQWNSLDKGATLTLKFNE